MDGIDAVHKPSSRRRWIRRPAILATLVACGLALGGVFASTAAASGGCYCGSGGGSLDAGWYGFAGSAWGYGHFWADGSLTGGFKGTFNEEGSVLQVYATDQVWGEGWFTGKINGVPVSNEQFNFSGTFSGTGYSGTETITSNGPVPFRMYLTETNGVIFYTFQCFPV